MAAITILSRSELAKAIVSEEETSESGKPVTKTRVQYFYAQVAGDNAKWILDRTCWPGAAWHVVLDNTQAILDRQPLVIKRARA